MLDTITDLPTLLRDPSLLETRAYIGGQFVEGDTTFEVTNPARGDVIAHVADISRPQVAGAIAQAEAAQKDWAKWTGKERANVLRKWYDLMMANQEDLAVILTAEMGKPLTEARGEIAYGASFIEFFAEEAKRIYGETIPGHQRDKRITVLKQPIGVAASITPWNFPNAMITRKAGPALAAGCAFVARPAELTPLSATALAVLADRAGIPAGVFSVVPTSNASETGKEFCENNAVRKLTFTGSTEVGRILMRQAADTVMKCSMELGGNAPFIVFDDADLDAAVEGAIMCKFRNNGQTCVCANRIYVQAGVYDAFAAKLKAAVEKMNVGDGLDDGIHFGPLINAKAVVKVQAHIADATAKGAEIILGGNPSELGGTFSSRQLSPAPPRTCCSAPKRPLARWRHCSNSRMRTRLSHWPMTPSLVWPPTSTPRILAGYTRWPRRWNMALLASTPASSRPNWRPLAASSSQVWAAKAATTASRTIWR